MAEGRNSDVDKLIDAARAIRDVGVEGLARAAGGAASRMAGDFVSDTGSLRAAVKGLKTTFLDPHIPPEIRDKTHELVDCVFDIAEASRSEPSAGLDLRAVVAACEAGTADAAVFAEACRLGGQDEIAAWTRRAPNGQPDWMERHRLLGCASALAARALPGWTILARDGHARVATGDFKAVVSDLGGEDVREVVRGEEHSCSAPGAHFALMGAVAKALLMRRIREDAIGSVALAPVSSVSAAARSEESGRN